MDKREDCEENDEEQWMENWDRRRKMAVVHVLCYVVYSIYMCHAYYSRQHNDLPGKFSKGKKRKANVWEREFKKIRGAIREVAEAIREGNAVMERGQAHVYSEREVFEELVNVGVERHLLYCAYSFLVEDPARVRAFFGFSVKERKDFLIQMMYGPEDP